MQTAEDQSALSIDVDADFDRREFNEIDILGALERDDKGNVIVPFDEKTGSKISVDQEGRPINQYGYLVEPETGNILSNKTGQTVFACKDLDERGHIPMPFAIEKFNFNPHDLMGNLDYQYEPSTGRAIPQLLQTKQGFYVDKKGRRVNRFGWLQQGGNGHIVDKLGRKKFDRKQLDDGDL